MSSNDTGRLGGSWLLLVFQATVFEDLPGAVMGTGLGEIWHEPARLESYSQDLTPLAEVKFQFHKA